MCPRGMELRADEQSMTIMDNERNHCQQCGICCMRGGPALHLADIPLVKEGIIPIHRLITIRPGELVLKPDREEPQGAACELVKLTGSAKKWQCSYLGEDKRCTIYQNRPIACSKLTCWDTSEIEAIIEKDTVSRFDLIDTDEPIISLLQEHEKRCPCPNMVELRELFHGAGKLRLGEYEQMVNEDILLREKGVKTYGITLAEELFYFGRPLFQAFQQIGLGVSESNRKLHLFMPEK